MLAFSGCVDRPVAEVPAWSTSPPVIDGPVARAADDDFVITFQMPDAARTDEPVALGSTLTYSGPQDAVTIWSSGAGPIAYSVKQMDGPLLFEAVTPGNCVPHDMIRGETYWIPYVKGGAYDPEGPNADAYRKFFSTQDLRLPAGEWSVEARLNISVDECTGRSVEAATSLPLLVSP